MPASWTTTAPGLPPDLPPRPPVLPPTSTSSWTPPVVRPVRSSLPSGVAGYAARLAGSRELQPGQHLSDAQVATLAPFFAQQFDLSLEQAAARLSQVRVYVGGPAGHGRVTAFGTTIYVPSQRHLQGILADTAPGRSLLVHELTHVFQSMGGDRAFLLRYAGSYLGTLDDPIGPLGDAVFGFLGDLGASVAGDVLGGVLGLPVARRTRPGVGDLMSRLHAANPYEQQAHRLEEQFRRQHPMPPQRPTALS